MRVVTDLELVLLGADVALAELVLRLLVDTLEPDLLAGVDVRSAFCRVLTASVLVLGLLLA